MKWYRLFRTDIRQAPGSALSLAPRHHFYPHLESLECRQLPSTFAVINTNDSGEGSFRQAILDANAHPGLDTIIFDIRPGGVQTIMPLSALPTITDPVVIDGTYQPGYAGTPLIVINGTDAGLGASGLTITAGHSTVKGLVIDGFRQPSGGGILLGGIGNLIIGNYIGTDVTGSQAIGNSTGVAIQGSSNTVGGTAAGTSNLISGNVGVGVSMLGFSNLVQGNKIGTDASGIHTLGNGGGGVGIQGTNNTVGGTAPEARNLISANAPNYYAVYTFGDRNVVEGNYVGTDVTGTQCLGGGGGIGFGGSNNTVGGTTVGARNLISCNLGGVAIQGDDNLLQGNYIGTDVTGQHGFGNRFCGVSIGKGGANNTVGGIMPGARNLISGNSMCGVEIFSSSNNVLEGNRIGTDASGTQPLGNGVGVMLEDSPNNLIGGTALGARNLISGNLSHGIDIENGASHSVVAGNFIGTDVTGTQALNNTADGIFISNGANFTTIGGSVTGAGNVISSNNGSGVEIRSSSNCVVAGNFIGTDASGTAALGNGEEGVDIFDAANNNTVGGPSDGARNVIASNRTDGVAIDGFSNTPMHNIVEGNFIGTDVTGTQARGNGIYGVAVDNASDNTIGGTAAGAGNLISGNGIGGVDIFGDIDVSTDNLVQGNRIGTDVSGTQPLGNADGVALVEAAFGNTIGGTAAGAGNLISGNVQDGVRVSGGNPAGNLIQGNLIGTDITGSQPLGNGNNGVELAGASANAVGGSAPRASNTIAFNIHDGVLVDRGTADAVLRNSIFSNGNLGIELTNGGNHNQEFPTITSATSAGDVTTITGTLQSAPTTTYTIELFVNSMCDPSGFGEGERFFASLTVATNASGLASFALSVPISVNPGEFITATATDPTGNTSQFSACQEVMGDGSASVPWAPLGIGTGINRIGSVPRPAQVPTALIRVEFRPTAYLPGRALLERSVSTETSATLHTALSTLGAVESLFALSGAPDGFREEIFLE